MNLLGDSHVGTPGGLWGGGVQACRETLEAQKLLLLKKGGGGQQTRLLQVFQSEGDSGRWVGGVERAAEGKRLGTGLSHRPGENSPTNDQNLEPWMASAQSHSSIGGVGGPVGLLTPPGFCHKLLQTQGLVCRGCSLWLPGGLLAL